MAQNMVYLSISVLCILEKTVTKKTKYGIIKKSIQLMKKKKRKKETKNRKNRKQMAR